jgi:hypothetical protein
MARVSPRTSATDHGGGLDLLDAPSGRGAIVRFYFPARGAARSVGSDSADALSPMTSDESPV